MKKTAHVLIRDGQLAIEVAGTHEVFVLVAEAPARAAYDDLRQRAGRSPVVDVEIAGSVEAGAARPPRRVVRGIRS